MNVLLPSQDIPGVISVGQLGTETVMIMNTSFYPIMIFQTIPHNKILISHHQSHTTTLSINKTTMPFSVEEFQFVPVCVGSNNCNNSNKAFIFQFFSVWL